MFNVNKILILLFLTFISTIVYADNISFKASVNKQSIALNESFIYSITVTGDSTNLPKPKLDSIPDFDKFGTSTSQNMSLINGKASMTIIYKYTLSPKATGTFTIAPATITFKGQTYSTEAIEIEVGPAQNAHTQNIQNNATATVNNQNTQQHASKSSQGRVFVKASVDKKTIYENEKLTYKFSFYTNVDLLSSPEYFSPDFSGFWNDGSKSKNYYEVIDGSNYRVDEIETTLYPLGIGTKTIEPAKIKIAVMETSSDDDMDNFFGFFSNLSRGQSKLLATDAIKIDIVSVPQEGKPKNFRGAIGDFKISASIDQKDVKANEPVTLTILISGQGNMKSINDIDFNNYDGFKKYDTVVGNVSQNSKEFKVIFVPLTTGDKAIPKASLSFFNPIKKQYEIIETQTFNIFVNGKPDTENVIADETLNSLEYTQDKQKTNNTIRKDINYNKTIKALKSYRKPFVQNHKFYLIFIPFILVLLLSVCYRIYIDKLSKKLFKKSKTVRLTRAQKLLKEAQIQIIKNNFELSLDLIYQALIEIISVRVGVNKDALQTSQMPDILQKSGLDSEKNAQIIKIFDKYNFYKFASINLNKDSISTLLSDVKNLSL